MQLRLEMAGFAQDLRTSRLRKTPDITRIQELPGAVKAAHFRDRLLAANSIDQHAVGRGQHARTVHAGAAMDIHWLRRRFHNRDE